MVANDTGTTHPAKEMLRHGFADLLVATMARVVEGWGDDMCTMVQAPNTICGIVYVSSCCYYHQHLSFGGSVTTGKGVWIQQLLLHVCVLSPIIRACLPVPLSG